LKSSTKTRKSNFTLCAPAAFFAAGALCYTNHL
jgi:hypothetical protein